MTRSVLVVDGTNVSWAWPRSRPLMIQGRHGEAQALLVAFSRSSTLLTLHQELVLVFDGPPQALGPVSAGPLSVLYPDPGHSADDRIVELVSARSHRGTPIVLASSDRGLRDAVRRLGATTIGALELLGAIDPHSAEERPTTTARRSEKPAPSGADTEEWLRRFAHHRRRRGQKEGDSR